MISLPLSLLLILYLVYLFLFFIFSFFILYHLVKFGFISFGILFMISLYLGVALFILLVSAQYLIQIDWQRSIEIFKTYSSTTPFFK